MVSVTLASRFVLYINRSEGITPNSHSLHGVGWGQVIVAHCDNMAVVEVINSGYSKDAIMIHLLR